MNRDDMYTYSEVPGRFLAWENDACNIIINLDHIRQFFQKGNVLSVHWVSGEKDEYQLDTDELARSVYEEIKKGLGLKTALRKVA